MRSLSRRHVLRGSLALAGLGLLVGCAPPRLPWQSATAKLYRIGVLGEAPDTGTWDAFFDELRELGYVEGQNIAIEYRWAHSDNTRYAPMTAELVGLDVDCIVTGGITASIPAKAANTTIPMVAVFHNRDAVEAGLVSNINRPEGNVTGTAGVSGLLLPTKLPDILKEAFPDAERVGVLAHAQQPSIDVVLDGIKDAAGRLGLQAHVELVRDTGGIEPAFSTLTTAGAQALVIVHTPVFASARSQLAALAITHRLPAISTDDLYPEAGGLMAYGVDRRDNYRLAATYVAKILKGAKPADLPMQRPRKYDLVLNLKTARAIGLTIPQSVLQQATEIIQ